jgi:peptidoglycan/xylan/chitin deacetylase (PgdA/CDA1 family)
MRALQWNPNPSGGLKRTLLHGFHSALALSGLASFYVKARGIRGATILMYHSVAGEPDSRWLDPRNHLAPAELGEQLSFLARNRRVVSMSELVRALDEGRDLEAGSVVLTFDDGYRDNLTVAAPLLAEKKLPALLYLATSYVDRGENQWVDQLYALFAARTKQNLAFPSAGAATYSLSDRRQETEAYRASCAFLLGATWPERRSFLDALREQLAPGENPPRLTLTWDEVRELRSRFPLFEVGSHTRNHVDLTNHAGEALKDEVRGCSEEIGRALGERPAHFSYPYERWNPVSRSAVEREGYRSAVGAGREILITKGSDRFALPRIDSRMSLNRLRFVTSGAYPGLSRALVGRA